MGLLGELIEGVTHRNHQGNSGPQGPPPQVSPPWVAEWDSRDERWVFINQQNGERTFNYPGPGYQQQGGYNQGGYSQGYGQGGYDQQGGYGGGYGNQQQPQYYNGPPNQAYEGSQEERKTQGGHGMAYGALGAVGGLVAGAALMHEGEKIDGDWDREKDRVEDDVSNFPDNAANWTGQQVGNVESFGDRVEQRWDNGVQDIEDIPQDMENKWDNAVDDVEDAPENVANWAGDKVGDVENFGDRMDNSYDDGRDDARYDNDNGGGW